MHGIDYRMDIEYSFSDIRARLLNLEKVHDIREIIEQRPVYIQKT